MANANVLTPEEKLVTEHVLISEKIAEYTARKKEISNLLAARLEAGSHRIAGKLVIVTMPSDLDLAAISSDHPYDTFPQIYVIKPDIKLVRKQFAPALLAEKYTIVGDKPTVTIRG